MMNNMETPTVGTTVMTSDGDELGQVKEIRGSCFKVDAPMQPDYWLGPDTIASATPTQVTLRIMKSNLGCKG